MKKIVVLPLIFWIISCSSDTVVSEIENQVDDETPPLFNQLTLLSYPLNGGVIDQTLFEIKMDPNGESSITNLSQEFNLGENISFQIQSKNQVLIRESYWVENIGIKYKIVSKILNQEKIAIIDSYLDFIEAEEPSFFEAVAANNDYIFGLHYVQENGISDLVERYSINRVNVATNEVETFWSLADEKRTGLDLDLGVGWGDTGISVNHEYLFLDYHLYDTDSPMGTELVTHHIEIYDVKTKELVRSFNSNERLGLIHNNNFMCISTDGKLELYDFKTNQTKTFDNGNVLPLNFGRPSYGFVTDSVLVAGFSSGAPQSGIMNITFFNFDSNEAEVFNIFDLKEQLVHIPSNVSVKGDAFSVEFDKERFLIAYSYEIDGVIKHEVSWVDFDYKVIGYFELPANYAPQLIFAN